MDNERSACDHRHKEIRLRVFDGGQRAYWWQCLDCGRGLFAVKKSAVPFDREIPPFDVELWAAGQKQRHAGVLDDTEFWPRYNAYLASPEWAKRRRLVLRRAEGVCEGCCERAATQVHHLTYARVFDEMLFDLVAICDPCHRSLHVQTDDDTVMRWSA